MTTTTTDPKAPESVNAALAEIGAAPSFYVEAARRMIPTLTQDGDLPSSSSVKIMPDWKCVETDERELQLTLLLARVRIESDECVRGASSAPVFSEALEAVKNTDNAKRDATAAPGRTQGSRQQA